MSESTTTSPNKYRTKMHHDITLINTHDFAITGSKTGLIDALKGIGDKVAGSVGLTHSATYGRVGTFDAHLGRKVTSDDVASWRSWGKGEATFAITLAERHHAARRLRDLGVERGDEYQFALAVYRKLYALPGRTFRRRGKTFTLTITLADMEAQKSQMVGCDRRIAPVYRPGPIEG